MLMKTYFIVLRLPGSEELKFDEGHNRPKDFWEKAKQDIAAGKSEIVSIRTDTGISEELRAHLAGLDGFTTYLIFHTYLTEEQAEDKPLLLLLAGKMIQEAQYETMVDCDDHFQLLSIDNEDDSPNGNGHAA